MPDADQTERDRQWAKGIRAGDRSAYAALFRAYHAPLCTFAQGYVGSAEAAKDLVQEVFLHLWERRTQFDPPGTVRAYLYKAVRNRTINRHEHEQVKEKYAADVSRPVDDGPYAGPLDALSHGELEARIQQAVKDMPRRRRQVFVLSRVHRLTYDEIGETLDISVNTVHTHIKRAMTALRERFSEYFPEEED